LEYINREETHACIMEKGYMAIGEMDIELICSTHCTQSMLRRLTVAMNVSQIS